MIGEITKEPAAASGAAFTDNYLVVDHAGMVFDTPRGSFTALQEINLTVAKGEFVCLIGHSGCGKSTVLTMTAGLNSISKGAIKQDGLHVEGADPERAVVFQSPSLFPWLTARENVAVGVDKVYPKASRAECADVVD